jgi:hypothetical protein
MKWLICSAARAYLDGTNHPETGPSQKWHRKCERDGSQMQTLAAPLRAAGGLPPDPISTWEVRDRRRGPGRRQTSRPAADIDKAEIIGCERKGR